MVAALSFKDIKKPECDEREKQVTIAMQVVLQLENSVSQALLGLLKLCTSLEDAQMADFLESVSTSRSQ